MSPGYAIRCLICSVSSRIIALPRRRKPTTSRRSPICSGFLAFAPSPQSLRLLDTQIERLAAFGGSDQDTICAIVTDDLQLLRSTFPLPEGLFPNGLLECVAVARSRENGFMGKVLQPYIFHANWTVGPKNKRTLLERAGAWFVDEFAAAEGNDDKVA